MRHLLDIGDLGTGGVEAVLELSEPTPPTGGPTPLAGQGVALLFEKPSARTRHSMEMAVVGLGGHPITVRPDEVGIDTRETAEDIMRTLACYHAAVGARVFDHTVLERMASVATVPVINLLSDRAHPLQALADLRTIAAEFGQLDGLTVAYVGDANNVARSLVAACGAVGIATRVASPAGYGFTPEVLDDLAAGGAESWCTTDPREAVAGADVVYTDVWASMGQDNEAGDRRQAFAGFTVDGDLMAAASPDAIFLHCLPAHRGEEVSAAVVDGSHSRVWEQAANRRWAAQGALRWAVGP
jgi:ornithine carbamoyltransferase